MAPPPPTLPEEFIEDILLRFAPEEPARLFRAALFCKPWCRLISGAGFRRKFRELHRTPPMLGSLINSYVGARFVPTTAFCPPLADHLAWDALDARHGRVLAQRLVSKEGDDALVVWDPITGEQRRLPLPSRRTISRAAAVVCAGTATATGACDHLDCHRGPFLVVFVGLDRSEMFVCTYSSDVKAWTEPISTGHPDPENRFFDGFGDQTDTVLVGNALHFGIQFTSLIVKYNLESGEMSLIQLPSAYEWSKQGWNILATTDEGVLGLIAVDYSKLCIWLMEESPELDARWTKGRNINLMTLLPHDGVFTSPSVVGVADGLDIVFLMVGRVIYTLDLKTCKVKLYKARESGYVVVPYMSFYTPELEVACTGEEPSAGGTDA